MTKSTTAKTAKSPKQLDLLFGATCPRCFKLITVHVSGTKGTEVAVIQHNGVVCKSAPASRP